MKPQIVVMSGDITTQQYVVASGSQGSASCEAIIPDVDNDAAQEHQCKVKIAPHGLLWAKRRKDRCIVS